jgi:hypothetical protein
MASPDLSQGKATPLANSRLMPSLPGHQGFHSAWHKLYNVGSCYLDLSLQPETGHRLLLGRVVGVAGQAQGAVYLLGVEGERLDRAALGSAGGFRLPLGSGGGYNLELELGGERFVVPLNDL